MNISEFDAYRSDVSAGDGSASYVDIGTGPTTLFVHGLGTSSLLWRNAIELLRQERRCIAVDLPLHGHSPGGSGTDFSLGGVARFLEAFCDGLELTDIDLVANDTGGAVAQVFAAGNSERLRSLALTNCDTRGNLPPKSFLPITWLARMRLLAPLSRWLFRDLNRVRRTVYGPGYEDVSALPLGVVEAQLASLFGSKHASREYQRWIRSLNDDDLRAAEPQLRTLRVPTALIWGTGDQFFGLQWAHWLRDTIPGAGTVREVPDAKLFFPDERASELVGLLQEHWSAVDEASWSERSHQ